MYTRPVGPFSGEKPSLAIAVVNESVGGNPTRFILKADEVDLDNKAGYNVTDLFDHNRHIGMMKPGDSMALEVNPTGVRFLKATVV